MTLERKYHILAISLMVAGLVAGGVSWMLSGTRLWVTTGLGFILVASGLVFAHRATAEHNKRTRKKR